MSFKIWIHIEENDEEGEEVGEPEEPIDVPEEFDTLDEAKEVRDMMLESVEGMTD